MASESQIVGASYIVGFYKEIQLLTHNYGLYLNLMLEIESKYGKEPKELPAEQSNYIASIAQNVRLSVHKSYVMYCSIQNALSKKVSKKIDVHKEYEKLSKEFVLNRKVLQDFVVGLNDALVTEVVQELLVTSTDLVNEVYGSGTE